MGIDLLKLLEVVPIINYSNNSLYNELYKKIKEHISKNPLFDNDLALKIMNDLKLHIDNEKAIFYVSNDKIIDLAKQFLGEDASYEQLEKNIDNENQNWFDDILEKSNDINFDTKLQLIVLRDVMTIIKNLNVKATTNNINEYCLMLANECCNILEENFNTNSNEYDFLDTYCNKEVTDELSVFYKNTKLTFSTIKNRYESIKNNNIKREIDITNVEQLNENELDADDINELIKKYEQIEGQLDEKSGSNHLANARKQGVKKITLERCFGGKDLGLCECCGKSFEVLQNHHIIPLKDGGQDNLYNSAGICAGCHDNIHRAKRFNNMIVNVFMLTRIINWFYDKKALENNRDFIESNIVKMKENNNEDKNNSASIFDGFSIEGAIEKKEAIYALEKVYFMRYSNILDWCRKENWDIDLYITAHDNGTIRDLNNIFNGYHKNNEVITKDR